MDPALKGIRLNEQQLFMIQVLRNPMPEECFVELRRLTIELLSKRVDEKISNGKKKII